VLLAHAIVELFPPAAIILTKLGILVAIWMFIFVFDPQLAQCQIEFLESAQLIVDIFAVRRRAFTELGTCSVGNNLSSIWFSGSNDASVQVSFAAVALLR